MTEKLFKLTTEEDLNYCEYTYWKGDEPLEMEEVVDVLNEQQATIEQLQAQLREKEEDEKLYANEILELREANKEFIQFKELGGDY